MENEWLKGGPFLEVSFLKSFGDVELRAWVVNMLDQLQMHLEHFEIGISLNELEQKISEFDRGTAFDETTVMHHLFIPIYLNIGRRRPGIFQVDKVSTTLLSMELFFYGSQIDVPEWNTIGVTEAEYPLFKDLTLDLFKYFQFEIGALGYEYEVLDLIRTKEGWPNEAYNLKNLDNRELKKFELVVCRNGLFDAEARAFGKSIDLGNIFEQEVVVLPI